MFSVADASIIVALITAIATYVTTRKNRHDLKQINHAVNHVPAGSPTLIQRVVQLEEHHARQKRHAEWEAQAICAIARQIGVILPEHPKDTQA